jgi:hypothetical protein
VTYTDLREVDVMVRTYENYEPWLAGTPVALSQLGSGTTTATGASPSPSWMIGSIVSFDVDPAPVYRIKWTGGAAAKSPSEQTYHNLDLVDQHVQEYADNLDVFQPPITDDGIVSDFEQDNGDDVDDDYVPYEKDTELYYMFDGEGYDGAVVHFHVDTREYEVLWSDGETTYYGPDKYDLVDQMVALAKDQSALDDDDALTDVEAEYDVGTRVYTNFDGEWWVGEIVSFEDGWYTVRYNDDSFVDYSYDGSIHELVRNAEKIPSDADSQTYQLGTRVVEEFSDGFYEGTITGYSELTYKITWEDGEVDFYVDGEELNSIVAQARLIPSLESDDQQGMTKVGKISLSLFLILAAAVGIILFQKRIKATLSKGMISTVASQTRKRLGTKKSSDRPVFVRSSAESSMPEPTTRSIATAEETMSVSEASYDQQSKSSVGSEQVKDLPVVV